MLVTCGPPGVTQGALAPRVTFSPSPSLILPPPGAGASPRDHAREKHTGSLLQARPQWALRRAGERLGWAHPQLPSPPHWLCHTTQGAPEALFKPGQEGWVPKLCSSASRANRGSARKGSRSQAFGNRWIKATAVLEGSSGRASESLGVPPARARPWLQHSPPVPQFPPL